MMQSLNEGVFIEQDTVLGERNSFIFWYKTARASVEKQW